MLSGEYRNVFAENFFFVLFCCI